MLGRVDDARRLLGEFEAEVVDPLGVVSDPDWHRARAELALAEARFEDAIAEERRAVGHDCHHRCPDLARIYDLAGRPDSARALYTRFAETPIAYDLPLRSPRVAPALERLGQLYDEAGDLENAAKYYARFVDIWSEADEELQPRVRAAQARLEEILAEIG